MWCLEVSGYMSDTHLPVNQAHDSRLHPHSHCEARVHVLMAEEGLETGQQEHESGVEVAFPQRSIFVSHEVQQKTVEEEINQEVQFLSACKSNQKLCLWFSLKRSE